ncbi:MAG: LptE family protein [Ferruginibacter sp.]|nr:LptE family protein [Chitinophagaceae bacterium]
MILRNKIINRQKAQGTRRKEFLGFTVVVLAACSLFFWPSLSSCNVYKFNEATIPDSIKTVKVNIIENRAQYINPQISQRLTDKLRQKIIGQTRLSQTNSDLPDWEISGTIREYSFSTSAISGQQVATNRLTVTVHITLNDRKADEVKDYDVSRSFEFKGTQSFQQAEATLLDEMTRTLTDEIFNKLFSNW